MATATKRKTTTKANSTKKAAPKKTAAKKPAAKKASAKPTTKKAAASQTTAKSSAAKSKAPSKTAAEKIMTESQIRRMPNKDYMNDKQLSYFRARLMEQREEVLGREREIRERLNHRESAADPVDRAATEEERWLDLRLRDRESKLLRKIDSALERIRNHEYGYCEETGEEIGIPRLLARPTATLCIDAKDTTEQIQAQYRD